MDNWKGFLEAAAAIITGLGLAMSLEWLALSGLMRLMPLGHAVKAARQASRIGQSEQSVAGNAPANGELHGKPMVFALETVVADRRRRP
jgi:hypothetical protein